MKPQTTRTTSIQRRPKFERIVANPDIIESYPGVLANRKKPESPLRNLAHIPPAGYRLVDSGVHMIGLRDLVFMGGSQHSYWQSSRRAGELGAMRRDSVAVSVAVLDKSRGKSFH